jgi:septal ring factor EnvC (AmiA/AmiB activator)
MAKKKAEVVAEVAAAEKTVMELIDEKDAEIAVLTKTCMKLNEENTTLALRIAVLEAEIRDYERTLQAVRVDLDKAQKQIASLQRVI